MNKTHGFVNAMESNFIQGNYFISIRPTSAYVLVQPGKLRASHKAVFITYMTNLRSCFKLPRAENYKDILISS